DHTCLDWIAAEREHDRDRRSRCFGGNDRRSAADCNNYRDPSGDKIGRQYWQSVILTVGPTEGDVNVLAFDIARVPQSQPKCHLVRSRIARRPAAGEPDHRHGRLLRARGERPRGRRAAEQRDELAPLHSITSSARASTLSGTSMPSAFAVLRLITSSYLVGACTGRSAGFSPL